MPQPRERPVLTSLEQQRARVHVITDQPIAADGRYLLLWLQQVRRAAYSYVWQYACKRAKAQGVGLVVVEDLCAEQRWNQWRHFDFAARGTQDLAEHLAPTTVVHAPLLVAKQRDLIQALSDFSSKATEIVTDLQPLYVARQWTHDLAEHLPEKRLTAIDDCGLLPVNLLSRPMSAAAHFSSPLSP